MVADGNSAGAPIHAIARFHGRDLMRIREGEPVAERDHHGDRPEEDAPAEGRTAEELTPDTSKPVSKLNLGRFGAGFIFFCIVFMMSGTIGSTVLLPARFNTLGIGRGRGQFAREQEHGADAAQAPADGVDHEAGLRSIDEGGADDGAHGLADDLARAVECGHGAAVFLRNAVGQDRHAWRDHAVQADLQQ